MDSLHGAALGGDLGALLRAATFVTLKLVGPPLLVGMAVGVVISLVQAVTQINEPALNFVPKAVAVAATLLLLGGFMQTTLVDYAHAVFDRMVVAGGP